MRCYSILSFKRGNAQRSNKTVTDPDLVGVGERDSHPDLVRRGARFEVGVVLWIRDPPLGPPMVDATIAI